MTQHPPARYTWTYSEYARFPDDGNRYEVIDGEVLVTPAPTPMHQHVMFSLGMLLRQFVERHSLGVVLPDVDLLFVSGQFLRPDLVFVPNEARAGITDRGVEMPPGLVVEILSPTSSAIDRVQKPRRYGDFGVPEYWVVDPEEKVVWLWAFAAGKSEAERVTERITWSPAGIQDTLEIDLAALFRPF